MMRLSIETVGDPWKEAGGGAVVGVASLLLVPDMVRIANVQATTRLVP